MALVVGEDDTSIQQVYSRRQLVRLVLPDSNLITSVLQGADRCTLSHAQHLHVHVHLHALMQVHERPGRIE